jgi:hypothetical protein
VHKICHGVLCLFTSRVLHLATRHNGHVMHELTMGMFTNLQTFNTSIYRYIISNFIQIGQ